MMTAWRSLLRAGSAIYELAIVGLGIETLVYATSAPLALGPAHTVIPVIPWLPANRWLGSREQLNRRAVTSRYMPEEHR